MSMHKLTAGSGYDYLTRQVAAMDSTEKGHTGLASYYTEQGETPGEWIGSGLDGLDGLDVGDAVTAEHMQALFGAGLHPLASQRTKALDVRAQGPSQRGPARHEYRQATRLGRPFRVYEGDVSLFRRLVAERVEAYNKENGDPVDTPVAIEVRARIRTEVATRLFRDEHGRDPADARELTAAIAKHSRPKNNTVAGYDLTFSPVKSVSVLWALSDEKTAAAIEKAHRAAIRDALDFIESTALYSRRGTDGVEQVDTRGLVATAFTHRDSRAGDPDLHTHVAVANKVQCADGQWRAIDGRVLYKAKVSASEAYNTALERHLSAAVGVRFAERPNPDARKRPVREIVGVDPEVNQRFSKRRAGVEARRKVLATDFQRTHGRPPTPVETLKLAQQATLETREAKHEPRTLADQRRAWNQEALEVLGSAEALDQMLHATSNPSPTGDPEAADSRWFSSAADRIVAAMEGSRATWQYWHVYAEAQRQVRATDIAAEQVEGAVDLLVTEVLDHRSVRLDGAGDGICEPDELRRDSGASVYTVAGATQFTSTAVLEAEQRLVAVAGRHDGYAVADSSVDLALLEVEANTPSHVTLNAGQTTLVREMVTSGARLQLAIAPAGSGKTTAMRALAAAWNEGGGKVIGLAPSAAAADELRSQIDSGTDTLAKLTHSLATGKMPAWLREIGPETLVVIDEAGMADTLALDAAVQFIVDQGGSVRLVGDDQQLAAIGAGGVLRDIQSTHGALQLSELVRFSDTAEGAASLALREGRGEAIGFYLDRGRVHVGDRATMTEEVFAAWQADRAKGLDSIMLAPTRELVGGLNAQARAHRLDGADPSLTGPTRRLADGNEASVGDLIITRENDRRLRTSATDWVKNGDRWTILNVADDGSLAVQHAQNGRTIELPAGYVETATELGYACTVHTAQGVTADTMHGLATGDESRQQLYTMLTRGRSGNHLYLEVVGDGDPHSVVHPELVHPLTPTDILEQMLARDTAPRSATSLLAAQADPAVQLGQATQRYLNSLYVAAEHTLDPAVLASLDKSVEELAPGLTDEADWPTLRAHLSLLGAQDKDPVVLLREAANDGELSSARDRAAVLDWRLDDSGHRNSGVGPLPWLPDIPPRLTENPYWGDYLCQRSELVASLAQQVQDAATDRAARGLLPAWAENGTRPDGETVAEVEVWRAAMRVTLEDRRATGGPQLQKAAARYQRRLNRRVTGDHSPALREWRHLLRDVAPEIASDEFTPLLAERLAAMSRAGVNAHRLLRDAARTGPLPDEHAAAALWWRMSRHLAPAVAEQVGNPNNDVLLTTGWVPRLTEIFGAEHTARIQSSAWWPALVANVDHGLQRGWQLEDLLGTRDTVGDDLDQCQALVWRTSIALDPPSVENEYDYDPLFDEPPEDIWDGVDPPKDTYVVDVPSEWNPATPPNEEPPPSEDVVAPPLPAAETDTEVDLEAELATAGLARAVRADHQLEPTEADLRRAWERDQEAAACPIPRARMLQVNAMACAFFEHHYVDSWCRDYLTNRFGLDLAGHEHFRPGHAPAGWNGLVDHLRRHGVSEEEMLTVGVATRTRNGRLIDRFRDRVVFPITRPESNGTEILGFSGRRHPDHPGDDYTPKYLNTPDRTLFHKGDQLYGIIDALVAEGATPVIVEGPMDAIAVTLASAGRYIGVAPLGTALTEDQARHLGRLARDPIVATDGDLAGKIAAERDFWMLTPHALDPGYARFPDGHDPSDLFTQRGAAALVGTLATHQHLGEHLLTERLDNLTPEKARLAALKVIAARPAAAWDPGLARVQARLQIGQLQARRELLSAIRAWDTDPRGGARDEQANSREVRERLEAAEALIPVDRWAGLAHEWDPRLVEQGDWGATAEIIQQAHDHGHDVDTAVRAILADRPLGDAPARDLRYRLVARLDITIDIDDASVSHATPNSLPGKELHATEHTRPQRPQSPRR